MATTSQSPTASPGHGRCWPIRAIPAEKGRAAARCLAARGWSCWAPSAALAEVVSASKSRSDRGPRKLSVRVRRVGGDVARRLPRPGRVFRGLLRDPLRSAHRHRRGLRRRSSSFLLDQGAGMPGTPDKRLALYGRVDRLLVAEWVAVHAARVPCAPCCSGGRGCTACVANSLAWISPRRRDGAARLLAGLTRRRGDHPSEYRTTSARGGGVLGAACARARRCLLRRSTWCKIVFLNIRYAVETMPPFAMMAIHCLRSRASCSPSPCP